MLARMQEGPFTFSELWKPFEKDAAGEPPEYREADRLIQRERKAGRIVALPGRRWVTSLPIKP